MARTAAAQSGYTLVETPLGVCAVVWAGQALTDVLLPEAEVAVLRCRLQARARPVFEEPPPPWVRRAVRRLQRHLAGQPQDLAGLPIALERATPFARRVYRTAQQIKPGQTMTYGELARRVGSPGAARAVGRAMAANPLPLVVPCHRVVAADGRLGGFSAHGGSATKAALLRLEGAALPGETASGLFAGSRPVPFDAKRACRLLRRRDAKLARLMDRVGPFRLRLKPMHSTLASLAEAIVYQQLTTRAGATIFARLQALLSSGPAFDPRELLAATDAELRAVGLSRAKQAALRDLAERSLRGTLPGLATLECMSDEDVVDALSAVWGVGRWTAQMLLIFQLGRPDVLPCADYALQKGLARAYGRRRLPTAGELAELGERWRPYRTVASWYLWRALELPA